MSVEESLRVITEQLAEIAKSNKEMKETNTAVHKRLGELEAKKEEVDAKPATERGREAVMRRRGVRDRKSEFLQPPKRRPSP